MRNRQFEFSPKLQYARAAAQGAAASSPLQFPVWCRILELVRTSFRAAEGGAQNPPEKMPAAKPHRSKTAKEPGKTSAQTIFEFGKKKILGIQFINSLLIL